MTAVSIREASLENFFLFKIFGILRAYLIQWSLGSILDFKKILRINLDWIWFLLQKCGFIFEAFVMFSPLDCFISPLWVWQRWHELCSAAFIWLKQAPNYLWSRKTSQRKSFWEREWDRAKDVACASQLFASCRLAPWTWTAYLLPACFWGFCLSPSSPSLQRISAAAQSRKKSCNSRAVGQSF